MPPGGVDKFSSVVVMRVVFPPGGTPGSTAGSFQTGKDARRYVFSVSKNWTISSSHAILFVREPRNANEGTAAVPQVPGNILPNRTS